MGRGAGPRSYRISLYRSGGQGDFVPQGHLTRLSQLAYHKCVWQGPRVGEPLASRGGGPDAAKQTTVPRTPGPGNKE